jgi:hypothetical protein
MTKRYLVAFANLSTLPLGDRPPPTAQTVEFDDFAQAKEFAEGVKANWVVIYDQTKEDGLTRIETYRDGRRYWA